MGRFFENFALYNTPPGTQQRMAVYLYASPYSAEATRDAVLAFTHGDTFKPIPGYKTFVNHFHSRFVDRLRASGWDRQRPLPRRRLQAGYGRGPVGGAPVRLPLLRVDRHAEQPLRRQRPAAEVLIADCDTYHKFPGDDIYPNVPVKYLRLDRVPGPEALEQRDLLLQQSGCAGPGRRHSARACLPAA